LSHRFDNFQYKRLIYCVDFSSLSSYRHPGLHEAEIIVAGAEDEVFEQRDAQELAYNEPRFQGI